MNESYEDILQRGLVEPPTDFADRVMSLIDSMPDIKSAPQAKPASPWRTWVQRAALVGTALIGATQLAVFMIGIWSATSAG